MSISLLVKKVIAGILAFLMPITSAVAVKQPPKAEPKQSFHTEATYNQPGEYALAEDEDEYFEYDAPKTEPTGETEVVLNENEPEAELPTEEATEVQNATPIAVWDVSETDEDDVKMYYYAEEDASLIDTIAASVRALFVPITAYAETTETKYEEEKIENGQTYQKGTVVISGTGATADLLYLKWLNYGEFTKYYEPWCKKHRYSSRAYILRDYVNKDGIYIGPATSATNVQNLYASIENDADRTRAILEAYTPVYIQEFVQDFADFWTVCATFAPEHIIIRGGVTEINYGAFAYCSTIKDVKIEANIQRIAPGAFCGTSITRVDLPATLTEIGASAFISCRELKDIYINGELVSCGDYAFEGLAEDSTVYCTDVETFYLVAGIDPNEALNTASVGEGEEPVEPGEEDELGDEEYEEDTNIYCSSTTKVVLIES